MPQQTTADKLEYLNDTKALLKAAIINKGQEVTPSTPFREYANKINNIETDFDFRGYTRIRKESYKWH